MSDNQPSGTLGGLISGLFGGNKVDGDGAKKSSGGLIKGALLAAGAFYLYKRVKNKKTAF